MLVVIETHPIQYHAPVYRAVAARTGLPVTVIYGSDFSVAGYRDAEFGASFKWDTDLLSGYTSIFLARVATGGAASASTVRAEGLRSALAGLQPSAVLLVGYSPRFYRTAWCEARRTGAPLLFRGETSDAAVDRDWVKRQVRDTMLRAAYRTCSRLLFIGARSRQHFERLGVSAARLTFSPYCVDTTPFATDDGARTAWRGPTRAHLGIGAEDRVVAFAGKLSHRKGVDLLLRAAQTWPAADRARLVLLFVGDGEARAALEAAARVEPAVRVIVLGFQNQSQLSRYYHAADVLALPSRHSETWGLVVNEALHHGLPVVLSDRVGCAPDLVADGSTGAIFPSESIPALCAALQTVLARSRDVATRAACRARVEAYTVEQAADGIAEAYAASTAPRQAVG